MGFNFHHVSTLNPVILLKCSMFLVTNVYPLVRVIPAIIASLKSMMVPLRISVERISLVFLELSRFRSRIFIEFRRLSACLMFTAAFFDLKAPKYILNAFIDVVEVSTRSESYSSAFLTASGCFRNNATKKSVSKQTFFIFPPQL